jgi:2',3'-cyclic-nucleotide 2'-phosphodiesterase (5'-nucleotidase family)
MKSYAGADGAFIAAVQIRTAVDKDNLASILQYPTEGLVVLPLTGAQIRKALELSVAIYPQPNQGFLQVSGIEVSFSKNGSPNNRITSVTINGAPLDNSKTYSIAMPSSLARGSLSYYRVWDKIKPSKTFEGVTLEDVLRGKHSTGSASRWSAQ